MTLSLEQLRSQLAQIDAEIIELVAKRLCLSTAVGETKQQLGLPTRDFAQEKEVLARARDLASDANIDPQLAEQLMLLLIRSSLTTQEKHRVASVAAQQAQKRVLVIGGAGKMGRWFVNFLAAQGYEVQVADPAGGVPGFVHYADWRLAPQNFDLLIVAAPLRATKQILLDLAAAPPAATIIEVGSIKGLFATALKNLIEAGAQVASIHPMFGPDTELLCGRHVIFIDLHQPEATAVAKNLFSRTMAIQVDMTLDEHDRLIAYVLGLSHALNIAFINVLAQSGEAAPRLAHASSTTFDAQLAIATKVVDENPHLYFEIQSHNEHNLTALNTLADTLDKLRRAVAEKDESTFVKMMEQGKEWRGDGADV